MRLIDADELTELLNWTFAKPPFSRKTVQKIIDMARTIDALPIDAVPIEFIRSEIKNSKGFYNSSLRRLLDAWAERREE